MKAGIESGPVALNVFKPLLFFTLLSNIKYTLSVPAFGTKAVAYDRLIKQFMDPFPTDL